MMSNMSCLALATLLLLLAPSAVVGARTRSLFSTPGLAPTPATPAHAPQIPNITALLHSYLSARGHIPTATARGDAAAVAKVAKALAALLRHKDSTKNSTHGRTSSVIFTVNGAEFAGNNAKAFATVIDSLWCAGHKEESSCQVQPMASSGSSPTADYAYIYAYAASATALGYLSVAQQVLMYNGADALWVESLLEGALNRGKLVYRPAPSMESYVYPLRSISGSGSKVTIGLLGDWGTGMPQAFDMLDQLQRRYKPDVVLHLGDVYYGGSTNEETRYQYEPVRKYLPPGVQYYTLAGNHDYYSSGGPLLDCVDRLRADGVTRQESSFFALEGDSWVFVNMDTGRHDSDVNEVDSAATYLDDNQAQWVVDKAHKAKAQGKRLLFSSHHQLFTLASTVGKVNGSYPAANPSLYDQLKDVVSSVDIWFWGHEHNIMAFQPYAGLKRGRLLGASAVPVLRSTKPYDPKSDLQPPTFAGESALPQLVSGGPRSSLAKFGYYEQHSFAVMTLDGPSASVDYYQMDWDCTIVPFRGGCTWYPPTKMWSESL